MRAVPPARGVLPISAPPIENGWVEVEDGRIAAVGRRAGLYALPSAGLDTPSAKGDAPAPSVAILPGLVNAHTHLELSYLRERIPPAPGFGRWVRAVMETRRQYPDPADPAILGPAREA